jgi:CheY-like chemotaxis protein
MKDSAASALDIIVVDDNLDFLDVVATCFDAPNWRIHTASSGAEALACLADRSFDLMITDLNMPGMSGYELVDSIRTSGRTELPIVVLTGYFTPEAERRLFAMGVKAVIAKPLDFAALTNAILRCLGRV